MVLYGIVLGDALIPVFLLFICHVFLFVLQTGVTKKSMYSFFSLLYKSNLGQVGHLG